MSYRILIADDSADFTEIFKDYLSLCDDIELVGIARDGLMAYEMLQRYKPDLLILDLVMPDMDGIELLRRIRDMDGFKPVTFVISALSNNVITREALMLGACAYFIKPISLASIVSRIHALA